MTIGLLGWKNKGDDLVKALGLLFGPIRRWYPFRERQRMLQWLRKMLDQAGRSDIREIHHEELKKRSAVFWGLPELGKYVEMATELGKELVHQLSNGGGIPVGYHKRQSTGRTPPGPRLLKVHVASLSYLRSVLQEARKLKDSAKYSRFFLRRSMSPEERDGLSKVYQDRDRLNQLHDPDRTTKFVVINERLLKLKNCQQDDQGHLRNGRRDYNFVYDTEIIRQSYSDEGNGENSVFAEL